MGNNIKKTKITSDYEIVEEGIGTDKWQKITHDFSTSIITKEYYDSDHRHCELVDYPDGRQKITIDNITTYYDAGGREISESEFNSVG